MKTKYLAASIIALLLVGCDPEATDTTAKWPIPDGLKDCKIYRLFNSEADAITVVRCPATPTADASTTTAYKSGKTTKTVTVVETTTVDSDPSPTATEAPVAAEPAK